jgi:calmodulin
MSLKLTPNQIDRLRKAFDVMDTNKDGFVTKDELKTLLKELDEEVTDETVENIIAVADTNGDEKIDFEEFCNSPMA